MSLIIISAAYRPYRYIFVTLAVTYPLVVLAPIGQSSNTEAYTLAARRLAMIVAGVTITLLVALFKPNIASGKLVNVSN